MNQNKDLLLTFIVFMGLAVIGLLGMTVCSLAAQVPKTLPVTTPTATATQATIYATGNCVKDQIVDIEGKVYKAETPQICSVFNVPNRTKYVVLLNGDIIVGVKSYSNELPTPTPTPGGGLPGFPCLINC